MDRTHSCGALRAGDIDTTVTLCGWVQRRRDHGGIIFIDLRDREGITQVTFDADVCGAAVHEQADRLRSEWVIQIRGAVRDRGENANQHLPTGAVEVFATELTIFNKAETPPFEIDEHSKVGEEIRLGSRYLDLRRPLMQRHLMLRHRVSKIVRDYFDEQGFLEIETPILCKSTPEGARDYLVPSRVHPGSFYALPQSPQLFKQLLMISGFDRYMQIARCFRDEDLRADRQPEFTQIDLEMSFVGMDDVMDLCEGVIRRLWQEVLDVALPEPFPRMDYREAMLRFGSDKPDLRFGLEIVDISDWVPSCDFTVFKGAVESGGVVRAINGKGGSEKLSRRQLDALTEVAREHGAKGLAWIRVAQAEGAGQQGDWQGPAAKFITGDARAALAERLGAEPGDILFFGADREKVVAEVLGAVRVELGIKLLELVEPGRWEVLWVHSAPMFEYDDDERRWLSVHHPFTSPYPEDLDRLADEPGACRSQSYDLVINGMELGGGSIRIHDPAVQRRAFAALGIGEEEAREKFGFLLDALAHGAPPHGGLAFGLDRILMQLAGTDNIRELIPFPKTQKAADLMLEAPSPVAERQLKELHILSTATAKV